MKLKAIKEPDAFIKQVFAVVLQDFLQSEPYKKWEDLEQIGKLFRFCTLDIKTPLLNKYLQVAADNSRTCTQWRAE